MDSEASSGPKIVIKQDNFKVYGNAYTVAGDLIQQKNSGVSELEEVLRALKNDVEQLSEGNRQQLSSVTTQLASALEEIKRPTPSKTRVVTSLNDAKDTLAAIGGTTKEAWELAKTVGAIAGWASVFFQ